MLPGRAEERVPSHRISPCLAGAAQGREVGASVPVPAPRGATQIPGTPRTPPAVAAKGAWADGMNERCCRRCSQQVLTSVA